MRRSYVNWRRSLPVLLIFVGAATITVAFVADFIGIGLQTGLGKKQIILVLTGIAMLFIGSVLATPPGQRFLARFTFGNLAVKQSASSLPGIVLGIVLLGLSALTWPGILGNIVNLEWHIGNLRPVAYGLMAAFGLLAVALILGRRRVGAIYGRLFPTRKQLLFSIVTLTASVLLTLIALEIGLRFLNEPFKVNWLPAEFGRAQFDPELGWSYVPNQSRTVEFVDGQLPVLVHHNELGFRVPAQGSQYDPTVPTLILVGGSYTMGFGLPYEKTVAGHLDSIPGFPFQVVNMGVEAYGTDQALLMLKRHFNSFNTKVVIYTYSELHINRNSNYDRRVLFPDARFVGTKPLFGLNPDSTPYLKKKPIEYEDLRYSRVLAVMQILWHRYGPKLSYDLTNALILEMKDYVETRGAKFIVIDWDWNYQGMQGEPSPFEGLPVNLIDTGDNAPSDWSEWRIPRDSHPNFEATSRVAQLIYEELLDLGLIKH